MVDSLPSSCCALSSNVDVSSASSCAASSGRQLQRVLHSACEATRRRAYAGGCEAGRAFCSWARRSSSSPSLTMAGWGPRCSTGQAYEQVHAGRSARKGLEARRRGARWRDRAPRAAQPGLGRMSCARGAVCSPLRLWNGQPASALAGLGSWAQAQAQPPEAAW